MSKVYYLRSSKIRRLQEHHTSSLTCRTLYAFADECHWECHFGSINGFFYPIYNIECNALMKYKINS